MHVPKQFKETNPDTLYQLIVDHPLGTLISSESGEPDACHIPFHINRTDSGEVTLQSHISKANGLWKTGAEGQKVLLIFHGPNGYISPGFYPSKQETGKVVPTWNYSVVHVRGRLYFRHGNNWKLQLLENLSNVHETKSQDLPWAVTDAPEQYIQKMLQAIVGLEIEIDEMVGNFKLSQNKSVNDYQGVLQGLKKAGQEDESALYKQMESTKSN